MLENIKLYKLTKKLIDCYKVLCRGVEVEYNPGWSAFTGKERPPYVVKGGCLNIRLKTLHSVKKYIREVGIK